MLRVAFVGVFSSSVAERVRARLAVPCEFVEIRGQMYIPQES